MKIKDFIEKRGYTKEEIAATIGVSTQNVKLWMEGKNSPRLVHALRLRKLSNNKLKFEDMLCEKDLCRLGV